MSTSNPNIVDALQKQIKDTYDYIVVGSGSSRSVVAVSL